MKKIRLSKHDIGKILDLNCRIQSKLSNAYVRIKFAQEQYHLNDTDYSILEDFNTVEECMYRFQDYSGAGVWFELERDLLILCYDNKLTITFRLLEQDVHTYGSFPNEMYDSLKEFSHIAEFKDSAYELTDDEGYLINVLHTYTCSLENKTPLATDIIWELFQQVIFQPGNVKTLYCHTEVETIVDFAGMKRVVPVNKEDIRNALSD